MGPRNTVAEKLRSFDAIVNDSPFRSRAVLLLVEDDVSVGSSLERFFRGVGYRTTRAIDAEEGLERVRELSPDIIVLDLMLPGMSGEEFLRIIKAQGCSASVLVLSVVSDVARKVLLFSLGAEDYVNKPPELLELLARVDAMAERRFSAQLRGWHIGSMILDSTRHELQFADRNERVTQSQLELFSLFARVFPQPLSATKICEEIKPRGRTMSHSSCKMLISASRQHLKRVTDNAGKIDWLRGKGWVVSLPESRRNPAS